MGSEEQMSWGEGQGIEKKRSRPHNQQGPTVEHMELCSMLCGSLDGKGVWGKVDTCIYMAESLHSSSEIITTLLMGCTQYKIKFVCLLRMVATYPNVFFK